MRGLHKYPFWFWTLFSIFIAYAIWNPWFALSDFMTLDIFWGLKVIVGGFFCGVLLLYLTEGGKAFSPMGFLCMVAILGACIASLVHGNWLSWGTARFWGQLPIGIAMALALRGASLYRQITGRVPVGTTADHDAGVHHS